MKSVMYQESTATIMVSFSLFFVAYTEQYYDHTYFCRQAVMLAWLCFNLNGASAIMVGESRHLI